MTKMVLPDEATIRIRRKTKRGRTFIAVYKERFYRHKEAIDDTLKLLQKSPVFKEIAKAKKIGNDTMQIVVEGRREDVGNAMVMEFLMWSDMRDITLGQMLGFTALGSLAGQSLHPALALAFAIGYSSPDHPPFCQIDGHGRAWHVSRHLETPEAYRTNPDAKTLYAVYCHHPIHGSVPHYCGDYSAAFPSLYREELHRKGMAFVKWWEAHCSCRWDAPAGAFSKADPNCEIHGKDADRINADLKTSETQ